MVDNDEVIAKRPVFEPSDPVYARMRAPAPERCIFCNALIYLFHMPGIASYSFIRTESCLSLCTDIGYFATKIRPYEGLYAGINMPTSPR